MALVPNWPSVLVRAWSLRFMALAGLLSAAEAILPFFSNDIPHWLYGLLTFIAVVAAMVSRVVAQRGVK